MDTTEAKKIADLKATFHILTIRDILIEKGLVTNEEYRNKLRNKISNMEIEEKTKQVLLNEL